jgi:hypothetical protein
MRRAVSLLGLLCLAALLPLLRGQEGGTVSRNFGVSDGTVPEDPREAARHSESDYPTWPVNKDMPNDLFTFCRIRYNSDYGGGGGRYRRGGRGKWSVDYPDSDLNFSFRLQQLTSLQVNPRSAVVDIVPDQIRHYPFSYMVEVGDISITDEEAHTLREYMLNGGFIMVDDFWGTREWDNFYRAFKQIWPDREFEELPIEHEIFHIVFDLKVKPQTPHISFKDLVIQRGITWEVDKPGGEHVHYRGVYDDKRRLVMLICWNTDTGEGWEQEGADPWYFKEFSEKYCYPLGINIVFYAMTH